jgi:hypothetical protein
MTPHNYPKNNHPKNYDKLFMVVSKKLMRANNEQKNDTTIHYDTTTKTISKYRDNYTHEGIMVAILVLNTSRKKTN